MREIFEMWLTSLCNSHLLQYDAFWFYPISFIQNKSETLFFTQRSGILWAFSQKRGWTGTKFPCRGSRVGARHINCIATPLAQYVSSNCADQLLHSEQAIYHKLTL